MNTLFSIIIPTYNRANLISKTIESVLAQEYRNFEILVIDDGSTDRTGDVVSAIMQVHTQVQYHFKSNGERAAARNYGLDKSKGAYVLYLDSDDLLYKNHLSVAAEFITKQNPEIFHQRYDVKNEKGIITARGPVYNFPPNKELIKGNFLSCDGVFIRRDIALENRFNEDRELSAAEDWELWLRISVKFPIHYINTITSTTQNHDERSVLEVNRDGLIKRMEKLIYYITTNPSVAGAYRGQMHLFRSSCYSYIALHLALTKNYRADALSYLAKSISVNPLGIFKKRFLATIKHLL